MKASRRPQKLNPARQKKQDFARALGELQKRIAAQDRELRAVRRQLDNFHLNGANQPSADEPQMVALLPQTVDELLPSNSKVLVISKGDENLIRFDSCRGGHFPQERSGGYTGFYPASSAAAISHLEALRFQGAEYLVVPATAHWWFETYPDFEHHLERRYAMVDRAPETFTIFSLRSASSWLQLEEVINDFKREFNREPAILNWDCDFRFSQIFPECRWFQPLSTSSDTVPYLDQTIDLVAVPTAHPTRLKEARRVASEGLILVTNSEPINSAPVLSVERFPHLRPSETPLVSIIVGQSNHDLPVDQKLVFLQESIPSQLRCEILIRELGERFGKQSLKAEKKVPKKGRSLGASSISNPESANGDIVVFLGPHTLPLPGWLPSFLRVFSERADAGVVGGRLINFDGTQNQIGGVVFRDGSVERLGGDEVDPGSPAYGYLREVDVCASTFFATRRSLLKTTGKPSTLGDKGPYATAEYCFGAREKGYNVYFEPDCSAIDLGYSVDRPTNGHLLKKHAASFRANFASVLGRYPLPQNKSDSLAGSHIT
jgi:hypothetical protein